MVLKLLLILNIHIFIILKVGTVIQNNNDKFVVDKATMSRSARIIMEGYVHVPADTME
jgi:2-methylaconitate cis-trans-isomerase PrpF